MMLILPKDANGTAKSEVPYQTAPLGQSDLGLHSLSKTVCLKI